MIIKVDGWLYEVPEHAPFIEFISSREKGHAGGAIAFAADGTEVQMTSLGTVADPSHWTQRIPEVAK